MSATPAGQDEDTNRINNERPVRAQGETEDGSKYSHQDWPEDTDVAPLQDTKDNGNDKKEDSADSSNENETARTRRRRSRPKKPEKIEKQDKPEKPEKTDKSDKSDKTDKTDKTERPEKSEKPEKVEKPEKPETPSSSSGAHHKSSMGLRNGKRSVESPPGPSNASNSVAAAKRSKTAEKRKPEPETESPLNSCELNKDKRDLGQLVAKSFEGYGVFTGEVIQITIGAKPLWMIRYEDGDSEDLAEDEMRTCLKLYQTILSRAAKVQGSRATGGKEDAKDVKAGGAKAAGSGGASSTTSVASSLTAAASTPAPASTKSTDGQKTPPAGGRGTRANGSSGGGGTKGKGKGKSRAASPAVQKQNQAYNESLLGTEIRKSFKDYGDFDGTVVKYLPPTADDEEDWWLVRYTDGDSEHLNKHELEQARDMYNDHYALMKKMVNIPTTKASAEKSSDLKVTLYAEKPSGSRFFTTLAGYRQHKSSGK